MKKYFIVAAAALAVMCACTKTEVLSVNDQINFAPASYSAQTKADAHGHSQIPGNFGVYAWFYNTATSDAQVFMTNEAVTPAGATLNTFYWPKTGTIDFVGYYPYGTCWFNVESNPKSGGSYVYNSNYTGSIVTESAGAFTTPDLMYAEEAIGQTKDSGSATTHFTQGVPMLFHHALTQVTVNVKQSMLSKTVNSKTTNWEINVNKITISGIENKGSVTIPTATVWTPAATPERLTKTWNTTQKLTGSFVKYSTFENVLVMPQNLAAKTASSYQKIYIEYTIKTTRSWDPTFSVTENVTATIPFITDSINKWEMGKNYVYNLTFTPTAGNDPDACKITFDPAVATWAATTAQTVTEVK